METRITGARPAGGGSGAVAQAANESETIVRRSQRNIPKA